MNQKAKILSISIGISIAIIAGFIIYGEITRPIGFTNKEGEWVSGNGLNEGSILEYELELPNKSMIVKLYFKEYKDNNWNVIVNINNKESNIILSERLAKVDISELEEWNDLKSSIFWITDYIFEPKPLLGNAVWSTVQYNFKVYDLKVVAKENISLRAGEFSAYKIAYYLGYEGGNELWIVKDMPLPVKGIAKDQSGNLIFKFELLSHNL